MIRKAKLLALTAVLFCLTQADAQTNLSFEKGLAGWLTKGSVSVAGDNAHEGAKCAQLKQGLISQRINVAPLTVVSFSVFVKTSDSTIKAHAFIRVFDAKDKPLLNFDSAPVKSLSYESTGNYTETPALISSM